MILILIILLIIIIIFFINSFKGNISIQGGMGKRKKNRKKNKKKKQNRKKNKKKKKKGKSSNNNGSSSGIPPIDLGNKNDINILVYCHNKPISEHWLLPFFKERIELYSSGSPYKISTLDIINTEQLKSDIIADGFADDFIKSQIDKWDIIFNT